MDYRNAFSPPAPPPDLSTFDLGPLTPELPPHPVEEGDPSRTRPERDRRRRSSFASFISSAGAAAPPVIPIERDFGAGVRDPPRGRRQPAEGRNDLRQRSASRLGRGAPSARVGEESRRCKHIFLLFLILRMFRTRLRAALASSFRPGRSPKPRATLCRESRAALISSVPSCRRGLYDDRLGSRHAPRTVETAT